MTILKYKLATSLPVIILNSGKATTGNIAVMASGTASVSHQMAIQTATAAVYVVARLPGTRSNDMIIAPATKGPIQRATLRTENGFCLSERRSNNVAMR
ncbi:MAG: hypothetical protein IID13_10590 [Candidatus Marinimicrobia bacterium]|nr:hypothetical protein [Candidatus Neomarinimicrobiota bacterium]